jgi:UDP-glucose 4-epimerase
MLEAAAQYQLPGVNIAVGNYFENNTYAITKSSVERFCEMYRRHRKTPVTTVRALNAFGSGQVPCHPYGPSRVRKIMPSFIIRALDGKPIQVYGDGAQVMDVISVIDVAYVLVRALEYTMEHGPVEHTLSAGTGRPTTVLEIAQAVINEVGGGDIEHLPMRAGETPGVVVLGDPSTLAPLDIDGSQFIKLEEGLKETVAYYRDYYNHWRAAA